VQRKLCEHLYDEYLKEKNISADLSFRLDLAANVAYGKWLEAKKASDYSVFRDSFAEIVSLTREVIATRENASAAPYDNLLDDFEKGNTSEKLDAFFASLKKRIVPLLKRIEQSGKKVRCDFMNRTMSVPDQEKLSEWLLEVEGLKKSALVLMTTEHPFTDNFGPFDVRVTTHYYEDNFISSVFSTLHEGGHALFMQGEPEEFYAEHADNAMSNAMHECVSRFFENIVGRSESFIHFLYPKLREMTGGTLADVSERELYEAVNEAKPSLVRTEADELTYCLHIMVRYEIEKALINGGITVDDVPALWNEKYKEYLGIDVPSDALGCLQDVHWSGGVGGIGYFPSYALGSAYGAQILGAMKKDIDFDALVSAGNIGAIRDWMVEKVFSIASVTDPDEWIVTITGESLNTDHFCDYLEAKYTDIYGLT
jgi:carboxypeptidase Taq